MAPAAVRGLTIQGRASLGARRSTLAAAPAPVRAAAHTPARSRRSPTPPAALDEAAAAAASAASSATPSSSLSLPVDDTIISVGFVAAVIALAMVTAGVAYLSFGTWRDGRAEEEAAAAAAAAEARQAAADAARGKPPKRKDRKEVPTRGGGRGFGG